MTQYGAPQPHTPLFVLTLPLTPSKLFTLEQHSLLSQVGVAPMYVVEFVLLYWHVLPSVVKHGSNYDTLFEACIEDWEQSRVHLCESDEGQRAFDLMAEYADQYVESIYDAYLKLASWLPPLPSPMEYYTLYHCSEVDQYMTVAAFRH